jgi:hypothetical protein
MERVRFNSPVDGMPDAIDEKKSRVLKDIDALFEVGSLSPDVLLDVLEQLKIVPHVRIFAIFSNLTIRNGDKSIRRNECKHVE